MQTESEFSTAQNSPSHHEDDLADFSTNRRVLLLSAMSLLIGGISAVVAYALLWLIAVITNLAFYHRFSSLPVVPQGHHLGWWVVAVPVAGALILTEKLARHGHHITREYSIDLFEFARVRDVMDKDVPVIPAGMMLTEFSDR